LTDPPYGTTACAWDSIIPFEPMWKELKRVTKKNGAIVLFGSQPFTSALVMSQWIWEKDKATNHLNAKIMPMKKTEDIAVFGDGKIDYNPQLSEKDPKNIRPPTTQRKQADNYGLMTKQSTRAIPMDKSYPNEILKFRGCFGDKGKSFHPTQKPVSLGRYLIRTYTNEGDTILDFATGSGSFLISALLEKRKFIGIEKELEYVEVSKSRIETEAQKHKQLELFN